MTPPPDPPAGPTGPAGPGLFGELKRRKVFRAVGVYGAAAFGGLEVADLVFPLLRVPSWTMQVMLWVALLGLPVAALLAWTFETTPEGVRRTTPADADDAAEWAGAPASARWLPALLALAGAALLGGSFYGGLRIGGEAVGASSPAAERAYVDPSADPRPAIAVLAFADMSPTQDQGYFSDGISEEILAVLSRIQGLRVASRSSGFTYKGRSLSRQQVGEELGVPFLLDGSVRREGDRLRVSVELVDASDGFRLWTETYDRLLEGVFAIQSEIAEAVAEALRVPLGLPAEELVPPAFDLRAYDQYLAARSAMRRRGRGVGEAVGLLEAAVVRDPTWAPAWAALAEAYALRPLYTGRGGESLDSAVWAVSLSSADAAARRALSIDPDNASALVALGGVHRDRWEWEEGERLYRRALALDPDNEEVHTQYAELLWGMGRLDEALREAGRALALDRAPVRLDIYGFALYMNDRGAEAEAILEEGLAADPEGEVHFLRTVLARLLLFEGRYREALERFTPFLPDSAAYRMEGEALEARDPGLLPPEPGRVQAQTWMLLGQPDRALDVLERAAFALPFRVQYHIWDPLLEPLWSHPRFEGMILPRVHLAGATARTTRVSSGR